MTTTSQEITPGLSPAHEKALAKRGIDPELAVKLGLWSQRSASGGEALVIPFYREGRIVNRKFRTLGGDKRFWQDKGGQKAFWNEDVLRDDTLTGQPLVITEGEMDAMAAIMSGYVRTVSVPDGAPAQPVGPQESAKYAFLEPNKPFLSIERCPEIIVAADGDEPGANLLQDLSVRLGRFRCKWVQYPLARDGARRLKDLNEVLQEYGQQGVVKTLQRAQWLKVDGVYRMSELPPAPPVVGYDCGFPRLRDHYRVRMGDLAVVTGIPSMGKSSWVNDLCCRLADAHGLGVAFASFEQMPQRDHRRNLRTWKLGFPSQHATPEQLVHADAWIDEHFTFLVPNEDDDVDLDWVLDRCEASVVQRGARVIVIDPWNEMDHARARDESLTEYTGRAIKAFRRFARKFLVHLVLVAHPAKQQKDADGGYRIPTLYDISDCYSDDTEALTKRGWLRHAEITTEDEVACFDPETGAIAWNRPDRVVRHDHDGEMIRFKGYGYDLLVSPNHRMVFKPAWKDPVGTQAASGIGRPTRWPKDRWSLAPARDILRNNLILPKAGRPVGGADPDRLVVGERDYPAAAFLELVGWWVAEGCFQSCGASLCQATGEHADRIDALVAECGIEATRAVRPDKRGFRDLVTWYLGAKGNRDLVRWLREKAGDGAENKRVPYPIFDLSLRLKLAFLNGYIAGDGHRPATRRGLSAVTTSKGLFDDLQRLAVECGIPVCGHARPPAKATHRTSYCLNFGADERRQVAVRGSRNVSVESYSGPIWCLTVPTGAYVVRRDGKVAISGNSSHWYNKCDVGIVVHRRDEDVTIIRVAKSRYHDEIGKPGEVEAGYDFSRRRYEIADRPF